SSIPVMGPHSTRRFSGLKQVLHKGRTGVINASTTTGNCRKRTRTSIVPPDSLSPVYVSVYEGKGTLKGQIGVASIDPSTTEFHLFNFPVSEGFTSLKSLLQSLLPSDVIIHSMASPEMCGAVLSVCQRADISAVKKTYYDEYDGKVAYARLADKIVEQDRDGKDACLSAFAALVKFAEHQTNSVFARSSYTINLNGGARLITCPLCPKKPCKMGTIKQLQEHFFHYHWQVHGYACHLCGQMYSTAEQLMTQHEECDEWTRWREAKEKERLAMVAQADGIVSDCDKIESGNVESVKLPMRFCRMILCCADCGWHTTLSKEEKNEEKKMNYLRTFFEHHNNDGLLSMLVYFPGKPAMDVDAIKFGVHLMVGGDPTDSCAHCHTHPFKDPLAANVHYMKCHNKMALECGIDDCNTRVMTKYLLEQHQFQHVHANAFFADFLSNSARIFPPPTNLSYAPRSGWRDRAKAENYAFGGVIGIRKGTGKEIDLVDAEEDVRDAKAVLIKKRNRSDKGYANAVIPSESEMAREVRVKLEAYKHCEGIAGLLDDTTWLRDEDAVKFQDWMEYWESEEGKEKGGPPKENLFVDVTPSIVRIPSTEVELQFSDKDVLSGFLLNDNVFYCKECDSIHKGEEAFGHLKKDGEDPPDCAMQETGEVEINPNMNDNMIPLFSSSISPSSSSLLCPHCPVKSCSITGLRVHIMIDHGIYVACKKAEGEVVGRATVLTEGSGLKGTKKRRIRSSGHTMKNGEGRERDNDDGRSVQGQTEDGREGNQEMRRIVAPVGNKDDKDASERRAEIRDEEGPELMLLDDNGDTDNDVVMMTDDEVGEADEVADVPSMDVEKDEDVVEVGEENEMEIEVQRQPIVRHFAPPDGDEDLCVVGEVSRPGFSAFQPAIANQREKKFGCPKCSERFMTRVRLDDHLETHRMDAGDTTIAEELGIPLSTRLFICKNCCLAFATPEMKAAHAKQHDKRSVDCETCCGFAFSEAVLAHHHARVKKGEVSYICGECQISYENETNLHEHTNALHGVTLFYFCKRCEIGSTNGVDVYQHYMREPCRSGPAIKVTKDAVTCIGVMPANQLHFQPITLDCHRVVLGMHPNKFVVPSLCNHRSMNVATERKITCRDCRGTVNLATYSCEYELRTGRAYELKVKHFKYHEPFATIRARFHKMIIEQQKKAKEMAMGSVAPQTKRYVVKGGPARVVRQEESSRSVGTVPSTASARVPAILKRAQADTVRPALTLLTPRNTHEAGPFREARLSIQIPMRYENTMAFLGGARLSLGMATMKGESGGGGGMMMRGSPVLAQSPMGNQNGVGGGGGAVMRGSPVLAQSPMGNQSVLGGMMMRGGQAVAAVRANGELSRIMKWARERGYSVTRDTKVLDGMAILTVTTPNGRQDAGRNTSIERRPMLPPSNPSNHLHSREAGGDASPSSPSPTQNTPSTGR
ncbi:hypothetical protein PRIPAC_93571, partial [Pristionchus pacificus]